MPLSPYFKPINRPDEPVDYGAYSKNLFDRGSEGFEANRVTREDLDANRERQSIRNALSGFARAAAAMGGSETVVPQVAQSFDAADKADLVARDRLASQGFETAQKGIEGLQQEEIRPLRMQSEALKLGALERQDRQDAEASDPTSVLSQSVRRFYKDKLGIAFPDNVSAEDLKKYGGDVKDAVLQEKAFGNQLRVLGANQAFNAQERQRDRDSSAELAALRSSRKDRAYETLPEPQKITVRELSTSAAKKQSLVNQIDGFLEQWGRAKNSEERTRIGQQMIKLLNSTEGQDAVGAEEARRLANELEPWTLKSPTGLPRLGQDLKGFQNRAESVRNSLKNAVNTNQKQVSEIYKQFAPDSAAANTPVAPSAPGTPTRRVWTPGGK
jgi:hypothetical protein